MTVRDELIDEFVDAIRLSEFGRYERVTDVNEAAEACMATLERRWPDHILHLTTEGWTVEHSFACRLTENMSGCRYVVAVQNVMDGIVEPDQFGYFRITAIDNDGCPVYEPVNPVRGE
jgi:hypothetical protein